MTPNLSEIIETVLLLAGVGCALCWAAGWVRIALWWRETRP